MNIIRIEREPDFKKATKWNFKNKEYEVIGLEDDCVCFETDMEKLVRCPGCKGLFEYGKCYTSRQFHTEQGFGYAVCEECYKKEREEKRRGEGSISTMQ